MVNMKDRLRASLPCSKSTDMRETSKQPQTSSDSESATDKEDDVKVCDICGDAGQEDLLAICSRCIDGAEHIYCMQTMLDTLPVGDWLCEDCKVKEYESQMAQRLNPVTKTLESCSNEDAQNARNDKYSEIQLNTYGGVVDLEDMVVSKSPQISEVYDEIIDLNLLASEKASIRCSFPTETSVPREVVLLSLENSLMNPNSSTIKPSNPEQSSGSLSISEGLKAHTSSGSFSSAVIDGSKVVSGPLLKSSSFKNMNSKPKVQPLLGAFPLAENGTGKSTKATRKGGLIRGITKSASFISEKRSSNTFELENEKPSVDIVQIEDLSVERDKEISAIEKAKSSKAFIQVADTRIARVSVDVDNSGFNRDSPLDSSRSSANASSNELNLENKTHRQAFEASHPYENVTNKCCKPGNDEVSQHSNHLCLESSHQDDMSDIVTNSTLNKPLSSGGRALYCQNCKEAGHPTHLCSTDKHCISAIKPSMDRVSREDTTRSDKWKVARETIISNQPLKWTEGSKELRVSSAKVVNKAAPPHSFRKTPFQEGRTNVQNCLVFDRSERPHEINHKAGRLNSFGSISKQFEMKPSEQISRSIEPCLLSAPRASVIPRLEFFWQGGFEVVRTGKLPERCDGLQAHFSSYASSKVFEAAKKFPPDKVQLEEVPCLSFWPPHFQGNHAKEHHIALFFFAKDMESYKSNYCKLLDNMLKYDLALKGNFEDFELLVFPSYKLAENSQRWNRLLFLWGIFKGRRPNSVETLSTIQEDPRNSSIDVKSLVEDIPTTLSGTTTSSEKSYKADEYSTTLMEMTPASCTN